MAKYKTIGTVYKGKDGKGPYIKISEDVTLKKGSFINLQDPRTRPDELLAKGVISEEIANAMRERALATPEFVKFELSVKSE